MGLFDLGMAGSRRGDLISYSAQMLEWFKLHTPIIVYVIVLASRPKIWLQQIPQEHSRLLPISERVRPLVPRCIAHFEPVMKFDVRDVLILFKRLGHTPHHKDNHLEAGHGS